MPKVPIIVLSGFLGSGKTTLLIRMLQEAGSFGLNPAVLMNELGKQDVDGHLIKDAMPDVSVQKLLDGCICCSKKSEISDAVKQLLMRKPNVIFIELTGVANPEEIADALAEPALLPLVKLQRVVTVLDAEHVLAYNSIFASDRELIHTLRRQMEVADLLLLNKTDLITDKQRQTIEKAIRKWNAKSPLLATTHSRFDLGLLFNPLQFQTEPTTAPPSLNRKMQVVKTIRPETRPTEHPMSYSRIQTVTLSADYPHFITQKTVDRFLAKWGNALLRAKGYFSIGPSGETFSMQYAGKRTNWEQSRYKGSPYLVLIGIDLNAEALEQDWKKRIAEASL